MKKRKYWEDLEILELVAEQIGGGYYGMTVQESADFTKEWDKLPKDFRIYVSSGWYFHGKLQDDIGYDLGVIKGNVQTPISGKFWCKVHGIKNPCIGYFWNDNRYDDKIKTYRIRGLVCYADDLEGLKFAEDHYNRKVSFL